MLEQVKRLDTTPVHELVRQWKIIDTQCDLDLLKLDAVSRQDEEISNRIVGAAADKKAEVIDRILASRPETVDDVAALLDLALDMLDIGLRTDQAELRILRLVRASIFSVKPDPVRFPQAA